MTSNSILDEFEQEKNFLNQPIFFVGDNAKNIESAAKLSNNIYINCMLHSLNLIYHHFIKPFKYFDSNMRTIINTIRYHWYFFKPLIQLYTMNFSDQFIRNFIYNIDDNFWVNFNVNNFPKIKLPPISNDTRWESTALDSIFISNYRDQILKSCNILKEFIINNNHDINYIQEKLSDNNFIYQLNNSNIFSDNFLIPAFIKLRKNFTIDYLVEYCIDWKDAIEKLNVDEKGKELVFNKFNDLVFSHYGKPHTMYCGLVNIKYKVHCANYIDQYNIQNQFSFPSNIAKLIKDGYNVNNFDESKKAWIKYFSSVFIHNEISESVFSIFNYLSIYTRTERDSIIKIYENDDIDFDDIIQNGFLDQYKANLKEITEKKKNKINKKQKLNEELLFIKKERRRKLEEKQYDNFYHFIIN